MTTITSKNDFVVQGNKVIILLDHQHQAFVNLSDHHKVANYSWRAVRYGRCFYAKTTVGSGPRQVDLSMHRTIAETPFGLVCHHRNRNSLDNRRENLRNMTKDDHNSLHAGNNLLVKYKHPTAPAKTPPSTCEGGFTP